jgi:putative FmdB family regulatory protein
MPLYEFHCKHCGADSEHLVRTSDWKGLACPKCGAEKLVKKLSVFTAGANAAHPSQLSCAGTGPGGRCCGGGLCGLSS